MAANDFAERKYADMIQLAQRVGLDLHSLDFHYSDVSSRGPGAGNQNLYACMV